MSGQNLPCPRRRQYTSALRFAEYLPEEGHRCIRRGPDRIRRWCFAFLAGADRRTGLIDALAALIPDHRDPALITHTIADNLRARVLAIACGYPDADDLDDLRKDPAFKLACGRLPESGDDLASQPTMSRWENAPNLRTLFRLTRAMVDLWCKSHRRAPKASTLDIDDTADTVHGTNSCPPVQCAL